MKVVNACREVGMPHSSFYYHVEYNPQDIADKQAVVDMSNSDGHHTFPNKYIIDRYNLFSTIT